MERRIMLKILIMVNPHRRGHLVSLKYGLEFFTQQIWQKNEEESYSYLLIHLNKLVNHLSTKNYFLIKLDHYTKSLLV